MTFVSTEQNTMTKNILIVEDNPDLQQIFTWVFHRNQHFEVRTAMDGLEAVESIKELMPDVIILDINMPGISGLEVLAYVRNHQGDKAVKVIIVTGNYLAKFEPEAELADLFLVKPLEVPQLLTLAQRLLSAD